MGICSHLKRAARWRRWQIHHNRGEGAASGTAAIIFAASPHSRFESNTHEGHQLTTSDVAREQKHSAAPMPGWHMSAPLDRVHPKVWQTAVAV